MVAHGWLGSKREVSLAYCVFFLNGYIRALLTPVQAAPAEHCLVRIESDVFSMPLGS